MVTGYPATQHTSCHRPRPDLAARADRAYRHPTNMQPSTFCYHGLSSGLLLLLSITQLNVSQQSQIKEDTIRPFCLPEKLISKHAPLEFEQKICMVYIQII